MIPIQELLNRIRWDDSFAKGDFVIGYYDRVDEIVIQVPLHQIHFTPGDHFFFQITDRDGRIHEIPFHRVREVYKNKELIWHRDLKDQTDNDT
ncbi:DUF504 domain-containing protein [Nitrosovibrio sp. Nv6]|uniref:DUF504 domain-containing protein n=1 Tax=Nitrosovibrio sp. Nv6 TaxID=1855340 RepID=UPI0008C58C9B|nr:DUF504 domain-containing protein [Nitrosovibrio sp. Nv6]SEO83655.1 Uncharacterized protein, UPF0248 family [Nitrosovibrio sp. Nv6]